jgi:hypothetical protein
MRIKQSWVKAQRTEKSSRIRFTLSPAAGQMSGKPRFNQQQNDPYQNDPLPEPLSRLQFASQ